MSLPSESEDTGPTISDDTDDTSDDDETPSGALSFSNVEESVKETKQTFIDKLPSRHAFLLGFGSCFSLMTTLYLLVTLFA